MAAAVTTAARLPTIQARKTKGKLLQRCYFRRAPDISPGAHPPICLLTEHPGQLSVHNLRRQRDVAIFLNNMLTCA